MIDHDRLFKELLVSFFEEFLELFAPGVLLSGRPKSITFQDKEVFRDLPGHERRVLDIIAQVEFHNGDNSVFLVHVEIQAHTMKSFNQRMFFYFSRLHEQSSLPIYPIALFTFDNADHDEPDMYSISVNDLDVLRFRYLSIELHKLDWRRYLRHHNPIAAALMSKMGYTTHERPQVKAECLRLLATLHLDPARSALIGCFVETYLPLDPVEQAAYNQIVEGFPMPEQQGILDLTTSWERKGRAEGLNQGRAEGQVEILTRLLKKRFGTLSQDDQRRIAALTADEISNLADAILEAANYHEWRAQLLKCGNGRAQANGC